MRAIAYTRVSTADQVTDGLSLEVQRERLTAYCAAQAWELTAVVEDAGESGKSLERPGLSRALGIVEAGQADVLVVLKLDRLTRSVADLGALIDRAHTHGFQLASVSESLDTSTASGRMVANILGSVAQWEREAIAERTRAALRHKQAQGAHLGRVPFGFRRTPHGVLAIEPAEQATIARIKRLRRRGRSYRTVAAVLNAAGVPTRKRGGKWSASSVRSLAIEHGRSRKARFQSRSR